jgi:hypothetical protein
MKLSNVRKAEGDWGTMLRESEVLVRPNYDAACFYTQQCAEKYLKARLVEAEIEFRKPTIFLIFWKPYLRLNPTGVHTRKPYTS